MKPSVTFFLCLLKELLETNYADIGKYPLSPGVTIDTFFRSLTLNMSIDA